MRVAGAGAQEVVGSVSWGLAPILEPSLSLVEAEGVGRGDFFPLFLEADQLLGKMETVTFY